MTYSIYSCLIWGGEYRALGLPIHPILSKRMVRVDESPRAGGGYWIPWASTIASNLPNDQKARLTTWLIDQRMQGVSQPVISATVIEYVRNKPPLQVHERADRLLKHLAQESKNVGQVISIGCEGERNSYGEWVPQDSPSTWAAMAWSESLQWEEVSFLIKYLEEQGWIEVTSIHGECAEVNVTVNGYSHIADVAVNLDSSQVFVAMWFSHDMEEPYEKGIEPAIKEVGYKPLRIDQKEHINKIDDEIIAEIRRSKFLVADFTQGSDGARGGVYYEAGFAHGLGLPVIFTCHEDSVKTLHFDTSHYNHIVWTKPGELREKLKNRILAAIGEGPEVNKEP